MPIHRWHTHFVSIKCFPEINLKTEGMGTSGILLANSGVEIYGRENIEYVEEVTRNENEKLLKNYISVFGTSTSVVLRDNKRSDFWGTFESRNQGYRVISSLIAFYLSLY